MTTLSFNSRVFSMVCRSSPPAAGTSLPRVLSCVVSCVHCKMRRLPSSFDEQPLDAPNNAFCHSPWPHLRLGGIVSSQLNMLAITHALDGSTQKSIKVVDGVVVARPQFSRLDDVLSVGGLGAALTLVEFPDYCPRMASHFWPWFVIIQGAVSWLLIQPILAVVVLG